MHRSFVRTCTTIGYIAAMSVSGMVLSPALPVSVIGETGLHAQARRTASQPQRRRYAKTEGLMIGGHLNGTVIHSPENGAIPLGRSLDEHQVNGAGLGGIVGWGFNKWFMLYTGMDAALVTMRNVGYCQRSCPDPLPGRPAGKRNGDYIFAHGDIGARFSFPITNSNWAPYFNTALTVRRASSDEFDDGKVVFSGVGLTAGGGVQYFINTKFAFDLNTQYTTGELDRLAVDGEDIDFDSRTKFGNTGSIRINAGVRFYPPIRR